MKNNKRILSMLLVPALVLGLFCTLFFVASANETVPADLKGAGDVCIDESTFPSLMFRRYIKNKIDLNDNGWLEQSERNSVERIVINNFADSREDLYLSLEGIEYFPNLKEYYDHFVEYYQGMIDLSHNTQLEDVGFSGDVRRLELGNQKQLRELSVPHSNHEFQLNLKDCPRIKLAVLYGQKTHRYNDEYGGYTVYTWRDVHFYVDDNIELYLGSDDLNPFADVAKGKYYYEPVLWAYYHDPQITSGATATSFGVGKDCTRAQIVTFLWKAAGAPEPKSTQCDFTDVKPGKYYYKAVLWAVENKITSGVGGGKFGVGKPCTREQVMTFLWKAMGSPEPKSSNNPFSDVPENKYYYKAILWAVENKITGGVGGGKFGVGRTCTRAQIVTFLYKAYNP